MGCLGANFTRIGGDLKAQITRVGGNLKARFDRAGGRLSASFSEVCGVNAGISLLASSDYHLLADNENEFLSVTP